MKRKLFAAVSAALMIALTACGANTTVAENTTAENTAAAVTAATTKAATTAETTETTVETTAEMIAETTTETTAETAVETAAETTTEATTATTAETTAAATEATTAAPSPVTPAGYSRYSGGGISVCCPSDWVDLTDYMREYLSANSTAEAADSFLFGAGTDDGSNLTVNKTPADGYFDAYTKEIYQQVLVDSGAVGFTVTHFERIKLDGYDTMDIWVSSEGGTQYQAMINVGKSCCIVTYTSMGKENPEVWKNIKSSVDVE